MKELNNRPGQCVIKKNHVVKVDRRKHICRAETVSNCFIR